MLVFVGAALFACLLGAATGEGCCTPDQWQGVQASTSGYVYHHRPGVVQVGSQPSPSYRCAVDVELAYIS